MEPLNRVIAIAKKNPIIILGGAGVVVMLYIATRNGKTKAPGVDNTPITYQVYPGGSYSGAPAPAATPAPVHIPPPQIDPNSPCDPTSDMPCIAPPGIPVPTSRCNGPLAYLDPLCRQSNTAQGGAGDYQYTVYDDFTTIWDSMKVAA